MPADVIVCFVPIFTPNFIFCVYFIFEKEREQAGEGKRERESQNLKQAPGSELSAQSPTRGSNSQTVRS